MLKLNKNVSIEETIGTGLPTLLAINLKLVDCELPEKGKRYDSDTNSIQKIRDVFGKGNMSVKGKRDGTLEIKMEGGIIILKP